MVNKYMQKKTKNRVILIAASVVLAATIIVLAWYFVQNAENKALNEKLEQEHTTVITPMTTTTAPPVTETETETTTTPPPPLIILDSMQKLVDQNPDTAGWITLDGTSIDNVVVQTTDNDKYLTHNFNGQYAQPGTCFVDYRCKINDYDFNQSSNIIIYGHNQADGTMFGTLSKYKITHANPSHFDFYKQHPTFTFSNLYSEYTYKIIATFIIEVEPSQTRDGVIFDYQNYIKFGKKYTYDNFIKNVMARTAINTGVDINKDDKFLTLSTCSNEFDGSRLVVIGRRLRDGESAEVDTSKAELNEDAVEPDLNFIYGR